MQKQLELKKDQHLTYVGKLKANQEIVRKRDVIELVEGLELLQKEGRNPREWEIGLT
jgi:hypothetical protein